VEKGERRTIGTKQTGGKAKRCKVRKRGPYRRSDELGDHLIHMGIPLHRIPVLDTQRIKKGIRPVAEVLLGIIPP
jgi:hypothetical protein